MQTWCQSTHKTFRCVSPEQGHSPIQLPCNPPKNEISIDWYNITIQAIDAIQIAPTSAAMFLSSLVQDPWANLHSLGDINVDIGDITYMKLSFMCPHTYMVVWLGLESFPQKFEDWLLYILCCWWNQCWSNTSIFVSKVVCCFLEILKLFLVVFGHLKCHSFFINFSWPLGCLFWSLDIFYSSGIFFH